MKPAAPQSARASSSWVGPLSLAVGAAATDEKCGATPAPSRTASSIRLGNASYCGRAGNAACGPWSEGSGRLIDREEGGRCTSRWQGGGRITMSSIRAAVAVVVPEWQPCRRDGGRASSFQDGAASARVRGSWDHFV